MTKVTVGLKLAGDLVISVEGKDVTLNGFSKNQVVQDGHGLTYGVDKDFWDKWLQENKDTKLVKGGFIFAHENAGKTKAEATEKKGNKSKTEPLKQGDGVETANTKG